MTLDYPLTFEPIFRRYIWGGRRLQSVLKKRLPEGKDFAESWEVVDHDRDQSIVAEGALSGKTLNEILAIHGEELLGKHYPLDQFPLLFKFLDCNQNLSIQVHPNDAQANLLDPPDLGKTEAWVVMAAEPASVIYAGLKRGFDRDALEREINRGTTELCLHRIEPKVGDCIYVPAGTVHALGKGVVVAEIQQASNTTFRLFDWNRVGSDGLPRPLHIQQALDVIDFEQGPLEPRNSRTTSREHVERLIECEKFVLDRIKNSAATSIGGDDRFHITAVIRGSVKLAGEVYGLGQTLLLPASLGAVSIKPASDQFELLDMYLP